MFSGVARLALRIAAMDSCVEEMSDMVSHAEDLPSAYTMQCALAACLLALCTEERGEIGLDPDLLYDTMLKVCLSVYVF